MIYSVVQTDIISYVKNEMSSCDTMFRYHKDRPVNIHLPHNVILKSSVYFCYIITSVFV